MLFKLLGKFFFDIRRYYFYFYLLRFQILGSATKGKKRLMRFPGIRLWCYDPLSVLWQYKEIVLDKCYTLEILAPNVVILDCGANVGMSIINFSRNFPENKIIAFEANPQIAALLKENLKLNNVQNCEVIEKAVWTNDNGVSMNITPDDASSTSLKNETSTLIQSIDFRNFLSGLKTRAVLKMDIEGAEMDVLPHCDGALTNVGYMFLEYHSYYKHAQDFDKLLSMLSKNSFRYSISRSYVFNDISQPVEFVVNLIAKK